MEDVIHETFAFLVGKCRPLRSALHSDFCDARLKGLNDPIERLRPCDEAADGLAPSLGRQAIQGIQKLLLADFYLRQDRVLP